MTDLQTAGEPECSAASLAAAVLDEEAARQGFGTSEVSVVSAYWAGRKAR